MTIQPELEKWIAKPARTKSGSHLIVTRLECGEAAWELLEYRAAKIAELERLLVSAYKRLCKYEGHLPITMGDETFCEKCEKPSMEWGKD